MIGGCHDYVLVASDHRAVERAILRRAPADTNVGATGGKQLQDELAITDLQLDGNLWVRLTEGAQQRRQQRFRSRIDRGDPERGAHLVRGTLRHPGTEFEQAEGLDGMRQKRLAGGTQLHAASISLGQRHANFLAERGDRSGHRRLRNMQAFCRGTNRSVFGHGDERAQLGECHSHWVMNHPPLPAGCPCIRGVPCRYAEP